jgi:hypothetical protein
MGIEVTSGGRRLWSDTDAGMAQSPNPGRPYSVPLPAGVCTADLTLFQDLTVSQPARTYWLGDPRIVLRDVAPPSAQIRSVPGGWINAAAAGIHVEWSAADNLGAAGIARTTLSIDGKPRWSGAGAVGDAAADLDLADVADGGHRVELRLDGDGTAPGLAEALVYVDRTPPAATAPIVTGLPRPGRLAVRWSAADEMSGVAASYLQLNTAPDGTAAGEWITVLATAGPGERNSADVDATPAGQGLHAVRTVTLDAAGNIGIGPGAAPVLVDTIAPRLQLEPLPEGPVAQARIAYTVNDDLEGLVGLGAVEIEVNTASDGGDSGSWQRVSAHESGPGAHAESISLAAFANGLHRVRVRVRNQGPGGAVLVAEQSGQLTVDSASPTLANVRFDDAASRELRVSWIADDAGSGVAGAAVQWLRVAEWATLAAAPAAGGPGTLAVPVGELPAGPQRLRLVVMDRAGNAAVLSQPEGGSLVDHQPPVIAALSLAAASRTVTWTQSDPDGRFGDCPTTVAVRSGEDRPWRTLSSMALGEGSHAVALAVGELPAAVYRTRVTACDAAGNEASAEIGGLTVGSAEGGAARPAEDPGRYREARIEARVTGGAAAGTVAIAFGRALTVAGRLRDGHGRPLPAAPIEAREARGRSLGRTLTDEAGRFRLAVRPAAGGPVVVGVPVGGTLLPRETAIRVTVRPRLSLRASTGIAAAGRAPVAFRGRFEPSPARLGIRVPKRIDLSWRDPRSGDWRTVRTSELRPDGSFTIPWTFASVGYTFSLKATVTGELGWPFASVESRPVAVTVRR